MIYWLGQDNELPDPYASLPYSGFRWTDCCRLYVPDYLHTIQEGIIIRMLGFGSLGSKPQSLFQALLEDGQLPKHKTVRKIINKPIDESSKPKNAKKIPATKFSIPEGRILHGEEKSGLASIASVACLADPRLHPLIPVLEGAFFCLSTQCMYNWLLTLATYVQLSTRWIQCYTLGCTRNQPSRDLTGLLPTSRGNTKMSPILLIHPPSFPNSIFYHDLLQQLSASARLY